MAKLIIANICGRRIGISSKDIQEVVELMKIHLAPFVLPSIKGTAFWRGAILTVVSLSHILKEYSERNSHLYLRLLPLNNILLEINKIDDIVEYNELKLDEKSSESIFKGLYSVEQRFVSVLDINKFSDAIEDEVLTTLRYGGNWR